MIRSSHRQAILLIAHGSRQASANADLVALADLVKQRRPNDRVEVSYLEIAEPTIPQGAERCVDAGARRVLMLPYFLSAGAHVTQDLERHRSEFAAKYPHVEFVLCQPLGLHPLMVEIVMARLEESP